MNKLTVFLIDDDYPTNVYNEIMIDNSGYFQDWKIFQSAKEALETLSIEKESPDIILLDINMPIMNGWDFLKQYELLEQADKCNNITILTTSLNKFDVEKSKDYSNVIGFREKPLTLEMVRDIVNNSKLNINELEINI